MTLGKDQAPNRLSMEIDPAAINAIIKQTVNAQIAIGRLPLMRPGTMNVISFCGALDRLEVIYAHSSLPLRV